MTSILPMKPFDKNYTILCTSECKSFDKHYILCIIFKIDRHQYFICTIDSNTMCVIPSIPPKLIQQHCNQIHLSTRGIFEIHHNYIIYRVKNEHKLCVWSADTGELIANKKFGQKIDGITASAFFIFVKLQSQIIMWSITTDESTILVENSYFCAQCTMHCHASIVYFVCYDIIAFVPELDNPNRIPIRWRAPLVIARKPLGGLFRCQQVRYHNQMYHLNTSYCYPSEFTEIKDKQRIVSSFAEYSLPSPRNVLVLNTTESGNIVMLDVKTLNIYHFRIPREFLSFRSLIPKAWIALTWTYFHRLVIDSRYAICSIKVAQMFTSFLIELKRDNKTYMYSCNFKKNNIKQVNVDDITHLVSAKSCIIGYNNTSLCKITLN